MESEAKKIISEFSFLNSWEEKYEHLISMGQEMSKLDNSLKTENNLLRGCQSKVWLHARDTDGKVIYTADSDAIITKGIAALLIRVLSAQKAEDILDNEMYFIDAIGLKEHLSMTRSNGLVSMIKQMKFYALAFQAK